MRLWANQCSCNPYVTEKASRLKNSCSRSYLGLISVMRRSWFCVAWVLFRWCHVDFVLNALLMFQRCFGGISVTPCHGDALVMFRSCFSFVTVVFRRCFGDVSVLFRYSWWCRICFPCFLEVSVMWGPVRVIGGSCLGNALLMSRECRGEVSVMFQSCLSDGSVMSW